MTHKDCVKKVRGGQFFLQGKSKILKHFLILLKLLLIILACGLIKTLTALNTLFQLLICLQYWKVLLLNSKLQSTCIRVINLGRI